MLIVFGGLPGVGKSTLSRAVAQSLGATWLRIDAIESSMWNSGFDPAQTGIAAYALAHTVATAQLQLGHTVMVDAVNPVEAARAGWRGLAATQGVSLRVIEVVCSVIDEHRRRVAHREPSAQQLSVPSWEDVLSRDYEPWTEERLTVDTMASPEACVARILAYCRA